MGEEKKIVARQERKKRTKTSRFTRKVSHNISRSMQQRQRPRWSIPTFWNLTPPHQAIGRLCPARPRPDKARDSTRPTGNGRHLKMLAYSGTSPKISPDPCHSSRGRKANHSRVL